MNRSYYPDDHPGSISTQIKLGDRHNARFPLTELNCYTELEQQIEFED
jgi:hypothetical protein